MDARHPGRRPKKRLIEAAIYWARGHLDDFEDYTDQIEAHRAHGAPPGLIAAYEAMQAEENADFDVEEDEVEVVSMFVRLANTWRLDVNIVGGYYQGCDIGLAVKLLESRRVKNLADIVDELLLMEDAAKRTLNSILARQRDERKSRVQT